LAITEFIVRSLKASSPSALSTENLLLIEELKDHMKIS
jgi:hypothetical protein